MSPTRPPARLLYSRGVDMVRMVTIPDDSAVISKTVRELSDLVGPGGFVFTSGGIGPTHDDVTYEAPSHSCSLPDPAHDVSSSSAWTTVHEKFSSVRLLPLTLWRWPHAPQAVAAAFGTKLSLHPETARCCSPTAPSQYHLLCCAVL